MINHQCPMIIDHSTFTAENLTISRQRDYMRTMRIARHHRHHHSHPIGGPPEVRAR